MSEKPTLRCKKHAHARARRAARQEEAIRLLVTSRLTQEQIAARVGVTARTLYRWRHQPGFNRAAKELAALEWEKTQQRMERSLARRLRAMSEKDLMRALTRLYRRRVARRCHTP